MTHYTQEQKTIIDHDNGHALVDACPGSGKTTTMAALVAQLLEKGHHGSDMLILMFGKDASLHFAEKLKALHSGKSLVLPEVMTFHSMGYRLCKLFEDKGWMKKAELQTHTKTLEMTAMEALKSVMSTKGFKDSQTPEDKVVELFVNFIDVVKSGLLPAKDVFDNLDIKSTMRQDFCSGFDAFEEIRKQRSMRFFSDLLYDSVRLLKSRPDLLKWIANRKKFIIVDEFQDINSIQYTLLKMIAGDAANVIVVGDVRQSIFQWRGSEPRLMREQFPADFANCTKYSLSLTFRYGQELASLANNLIANNEEGKGIACVPHAANPATQMHVHATSNPGKQVLSLVREHMKAGVALKDMAILCRLYSASAPIELELIANNIPCGTEDGYSVFNCNEFKGLMTVLEMATGDLGKHTEKERQEKLTALLKFPYPGVSAREIEQLSRRMCGNKRDYGKSLTGGLSSDLKVYQKKKLKERGELFNLIEKQGRDARSTKQILNAYIMESELKKSIQSMALSSTEASEALTRLDVIVNYMCEISEKPSSVIERLSQMKNDRTRLNNEASKILVASIHKAKGLEWPVVFMPGIDEGRFPYEAKGEYHVPSEIEEERRLFFVGITRSINHCHILSPNDPDLNHYLKSGKKPVKHHEGKGVASRFVYETNFHSVKNKVKAPEKTSVEEVSTSAL